MTGHDFDVLLAVWTARNHPTHVPNETPGIRDVLGAVYGEVGPPPEWLNARPGWHGPLVDAECDWCLEPDVPGEPEPDCPRCHGLGKVKVEAQPPADQEQFYPTNEVKVHRSLVMLRTLALVELSPMPQAHRTPQEQHLGINMHCYHATRAGRAMLTLAGVQV
jgi:hypothetical protein